MQESEYEEVTVDFATADGSDFEVRITPPPGKRFANLTTPTTTEFRDVTGALFDMKRVIELCEEYLSAMENNAARAVQDALWMSAIILYARCFNVGVRQRLDTTALDAVPGRPREVHQHFLDLRDKFLAHSVNIYEQTPVLAIIDLVNNDVERIGTIHAWANPMNEIGARHLLQLAQAFVVAGERQRSILDQQVGREALALTSDEVGRLPDLQMMTPTVARASRRRKP
ncbi:hypothetical protein WDJ51_04240 [Rathayibacter sp. YIM 133350]|uniref:hypothetical protein n=1 Tax=Rathayibacter sp. YIM 133350 TaxID=3131992 RepID=UPI00307D91BB